MSDLSLGTAENKIPPEDFSSVRSSPPSRSSGSKQWLLLCASAAGMFLGFISATLLMRYYYSSGGSRRWLCGWIQTAGFPICGLTMLSIILRRGRSAANTGDDLAPLNFKVVASLATIGVIIAFDNFLYSYGLSYLPASTAGLLSSSQLAFNSLFALFILKKTITPYIWNSIVLVISSAVLLGLHSRADKLPGVTPRQTVAGYVMVITAAGLYGLILSLTDLVFTRVLRNRSRCSLLVLQVQSCTALVATVVSTVGMAVNNDFAAIPKEAAAFKSGRGMYVVTLLCSAFAWQAAFLGTMGVIFLSSSLLAGVILTVVIPVGSIFAFVFFDDEFGGLKIMALTLSCWGFVSYVYGEYVESTSDEKEYVSPV